MTWSVALYGSEIRTLRKEDIKRLQAFEMSYHRLSRCGRAERTSWTELRTNEEILKMVDEKRSTYKNNPKPTEKLFGPHNERRLLSKNYKRGKNGRYTDERKTKNDVTGLDKEIGLQQVEGEIWTS